MFKLPVYAVIAAALGCFSYAQAAIDGPGASGGGSRLQSAFRLTAFELIQKVSRNAKANALCPSETLLAGLNNSKVLVTDRLMDLETGMPVDERHLDAWSGPGNIQLLHAVWTKYLRDNDRLDPSVSALILHEVYRTTGTCNDHLGELSTRAIQALAEGPSPQASSKYSKVFEFKHVGTGWEEKYWRGDDNFWLRGVACERPVDFSQPRSGIRCVMVGQHHSLFLRVVVTTGDPKHPFATQVNFNRFYVGSNHYDRLENLLRMVSPEEPLFVVFDLQTGDLAYGFDLAQLTLLKDY